MTQITLAVLGAAGRGGHLARHAVATGLFRVVAVADATPALAAQAAADLGGTAYGDVDELLARCDAQAVVVGTPMHLHTRHAVAALDAGRHVLCEVVPCVSWEEAKALTAAVRRSRGVFMLAENYCYFRDHLLVRELVRRGLFGQTYLAEGEYLHELKGLNPVGGWRRRWQTGIDGNTYCTHALGPLLQWMPGDRVVSVACVGGGHHHRDAAGLPFEQQSGTITLGRTARGGAIELRLDMLSDRPHQTNYRLIGTDGSFESGRHGGQSQVWLRSIHGGDARWEPLLALEERFPGGPWQRWGTQSLSGPDAGYHAGADFIEMGEFGDVILGRIDNPFPIDTAMDMALPGLASQDSVARAGAWVAVPDSRSWSA